MPKAVTTQPTQNQPTTPSFPPHEQAAAAEPKSNGLKEVMGKHGTKPTNQTGKDGRKVYYPEIVVNGVVIPRKNFKVTQAIAREILKYETEEQYKDRMTELNPQLDREQCYFQSPDGDEKMASGKPVPRYHFIDPAGHKVICWFNINNRPFDPGWGARIGQDILSREYMFNGQPIIVTKTKLTADGQHRLLGLIFACIEWGGKNADHHRILWPEEPYIESLIVCGLDESAKVWMTLDNTKARTEAENFLTTDMIDWTSKSTSRRECAKYLQDAVQLLWSRTGAEGEGSFSRYRTHITAMDFAAKHKTLLKCVKHVWEENTSDGRAISALKLSPGQCAAMCYMMASCRSDGDAYRHHATTAEREESQLSFEELDRAKLFFSLLAASDPNVEGGNKQAIALMRPVRHALGMILDPEVGAGGSKEERQAILAKAWAAYIDRGTIEDADISLRYAEDREVGENGQPGALKDRWLDECPLFGGIDVGYPKKSTAKPQGVKTSKEQVEEGKRQEKARRDEQLRLQIEASRRRIEPTDAENQKRQLTEFERMWPGKLIVIRMPSGALRAVGSHATALAPCTGIDVNDNMDPVRLSIAKADAGECLSRIAAAHPNAIVVSKLTTPEGQPAQFRGEIVSTGAEVPAAQVAA